MKKFVEYERRKRRYDFQGIKPMHKDVYLAWPSRARAECRWTMRDYHYRMLAFNRDTGIIANALCMPEIHTLDMETCWKRLEGHLKDALAEVNHVMRLEDEPTPYDTYIVEELSARNRCIGALLYAKLYWTHILSHLR